MNAHESKGGTQVRDVSSAALIREVMPNVCECGHNVSRHGTGSGCWDCECGLLRPSDAALGRTNDAFDEHGCLNVSRAEFDAASDAAANRDELIQLCQGMVYEVEVLGIHVASVPGYGLAKMVLEVLDAD